MKTSNDAVGAPGLTGTTRAALPVWSRALALLSLSGVCAGSALAAPIATAPRAHLSAETQRVYDNICSANGWLLGLGQLSYGPKGKLVVGDWKLDMQHWQELYGKHEPACYEWDLGEMPWLWNQPPASRRDWTAAKVFAQDGGLPWFRLTLHNFTVPLGPRQAGSANDRTGWLPPVLPGGAKHAEFLAYFRELAGQFRAFGRPCVFRPFHEMNGRWFWWGGQPEEYRRLWRLVFDLFREEGVRNVIWCWAASPDQSRLKEHYPGDDVVDIVGTDQYFDGPSLPEYTHRAAEEITGFAPEKPFFLAELGPMARADFWKSREAELPQIPHLRGMMLWLARGWRVWGSDPARGSLIDETSPPEQVAAFRAFLDLPRTLTSDRFTAPAGEIPRARPLPGSAGEGGTAR